jgi:hypothetical protein
MLAGFNSETRDAADNSFADRVRNAGRVGGDGASWHAGRAAFNLLSGQRWLDVSYPLGGRVLDFIGSSR